MIHDFIKTICDIHNINELPDEIIPYIYELINRKDITLICNNYNVSCDYNLFSSIYINNKDKIKQIIDKYKFNNKIDEISFCLYMIFENLGTNIIRYKLCSIA